MTDRNPVNAELTAVTISREGTRVTARIDGPSSQEDWAASALHRAGFVPVELYRERFHRLPTGMTDAAEQRRTVTSALDLLHAEGFVFACDAELIDQNQPVSGRRKMGLGDRIGYLGESIATAGHTRDAVAALSELTAPGDGVLQRVSEVLHETADWWAELGDSADPHYANRLRYITEQLDSYAREIRAMRGDLADRHATHPHRVRVVQNVPDAPAEPRVAAALAVSPTARRPAGASVLPPAPTYLVPPARTLSTPSR